MGRIMDKPNHMLKEKPSLKLAKDIPPEEIKKRRAKKLKRRVRRVLSLSFFLAMVIVGNYILLTTRFHENARTGSIYLHAASERNNYEAFGNGIVRYNRERVAFLNLRNREQWTWGAQFDNPIFTASAQSFAIADKGANQIMVFNQGGLIGEFETIFPIERIALSKHGIVAVILRNPESPLIMIYDATGTLLVENHVPFSTLGYPTALALSPDGTVLVVGYLSINGGKIRSTVVHYNFQDPQSARSDFVVHSEELEDAIVVELFFMGERTSAVITDSSFIIYEGIEAPRREVQVFFHEEIKSVFYTNDYIGYVLVNDERTGYELRLHNSRGDVVMSREFTGEYSNIQMLGNDIIMFDGFGLCIISKRGVIRFQGNIDVNPLLVMPAAGINRFHVMSAYDLRTINLVR